ncbi:hypothetical protein EMEDMD4_280112 [Sinorhizobium medicae]|uniref:Uncharacterized protein n=1 Tax=Sinorhizobium medicae TaxID=110321 RepID=A0A508WWI4_9HYPH|nr:hypothetical protein EMEDMD4_280112 [Sinorhizobium medicae]
MHGGRSARHALDRKARAVPRNLLEEFDVAVVIRAGVTGKGSGQPDCHVRSLVLDPSYRACDAGHSCLRAVAARLCARRVISVCRPDPRPDRGLRRPRQLSGGTA